MCWKARCANPATKLRITAQLIQADTGYHLWSETYDRELDDVFAIQDEISAAIGEALRVELALGTDQEHRPRALRNPPIPQPTRPICAAVTWSTSAAAATSPQAVEELKRAVRLDPDFAPAHAWMAIAWTMMLDSPATYGELSLAEVHERRAPHLEKALELDPNLAEAYGAQALRGHEHRRFRTGAWRQTARALELNPVYVDAMNWRQICGRRVRGLPGFPADPATYDGGRPPVHHRPTELCWQPGAA